MQAELGLGRAGHQLSKRAPTPKCITKSTWQRTPLASWITSLGHYCLEILPKTQRPKASITTWKRRRCSNRAAVDVVREGLVARLSWPQINSSQMIRRTKWTSTTTTCLFSLGSKEWRDIPGTEHSSVGCTLGARSVPAAWSARTYGAPFKTAVQAPSNTTKRTGACGRRDASRLGG